MQFALDALGADHVMGILYVVQYPRCGHAADVLKEPIIRQVGQCSLCEAECERA
ncbi:hypothetical protein TPY_3153 [Sulfobacillus acidophilus TPY]|nr:hypothetical protein TPY_3153 [Sulfobacillus acidophilus TPY]